MDIMGFKFEYKMHLRVEHDYCLLQEMKQMTFKSRFEFMITTYLALGYNQNPTVESQHAVIEYDPSNGLLTLRDLSSRKGTFLNEQMIDGVVRLSVGSKLRFGCCSTIYEITSSAKNMPESVTGTQPVNVDDNVKRSEKLPPWIKVCNYTDLSQINPTKPISTDACQLSPLVSPDNKPDYLSTKCDENSREANVPLKLPSSCSSASELNTNLTYYLKANQVHRLAPLEAITTQKDILIKHLQNQITQMNQINKLFHYSGSCTPLITSRNSINPPLFNDNESQTDLVQNRSESSNEIPYHHQQQQQQQNLPIRTRPGSTPSQVKLCLNNSMGNHQDLQNNNHNNNNNVIDVKILEKVRRERQILSGLVTQLQKDLSNRDYNKSQDKKQYNMEKEQYEKEIDNIRQKYKTAETRCHSLQDELDRMKLDYNKLNHSIEMRTVTENQLHKELEEAQTKLIELERSIRIHQLDKQEAISEFERLRTRVMRIVFAVISEDQFNAKKIKESTDDNISSYDKSKINSETSDSVITDNSKSPNPNETSLIDMNPCHNANYNEQLLDRIQFLADDYKRLQHELNANHLEEDQIKQHNKEVEKELHEFIHQNMKDTPRFRSSLRLKQEIELLGTYVPSSEVIKQLQHILLDDLQDQVNTQQRLEDCTQEAITTIQSHCTAEITSSVIQQKMDLLKQLKVSEMEHQEELIKTKSLIQNEWKTLMDDKIAKMNYEKTIHHLPTLQHEIELKDTEINELKLNLDQQKQINTKLHDDIVKQCELQWKSEIDCHREQVRQHAKTICVMEERLIKLTKQLKENKSEMIKLKRINSARHNDDTNKHSSSNSFTDDNTNPKLIENLKHEISHLQTIINDQSSTIEVLRSDLAGTQAQLSDLKGELTEAQKEEIENALNYSRQTNVELCNTKAQLVNLKDSLEQMNKQLQEKDDQIKSECSHHHEQFNSLSLKSTQELINLGNECKGERHHEVIERQRDALSQLRQQIRDQYTYKSPKGDLENEELIRQISQLKRENAELRSKSILAEVVPSTKGLTNNSTLALDNGPHSDQLTDQRLSSMDHIGLRNAMDALHTSEECYLNLVRSISNHLDVDRLPGQRSLIQVPRIEREIVKKERQHTIELLSQRIDILKDQLQHKENLLNEYERDMSRLKQAEALADAKSEQLDQFINELRSKEIEIQLLRQRLDKTREALLKEQCTLAAIKNSVRVKPSQKKQLRQSSDEQNDKEQRQRKTNQEKLKRKDYEIDTLKHQLMERDKKLQLLSEQMTKLQMGLKDQAN
ncbi:Forkhead-associated domain-containing protein [Schistosoma japonicum]|nr:Forkhead-associated domain-containing protein [Schistosoma japonicum]